MMVVISDLGIKMSIDNLEPYAQNIGNMACIGKIDLLKLLRIVGLEILYIHRIF